MTIFVFIFGIFWILLGRSVFESWFNHVTIYSSIWCGSLMLFQSRLIHYFDLAPETWLVIFTGWSAFILGSLSVCAARYALNYKGRTFRADLNSPDQTDLVRILERSIWITSIASGLTVLQHWYIILKMFGTVQNAVILGNLLYTERLADAFPGQIPYLASAGLAGAFFGGVLSRIQGRFRFIAIIPLVITFADAVAVMSRAQLVIVFVLFFSGYLLGKQLQRREGVLSLSRFRQVVIVAAAVLLTVGGAEFVRSNRGMIENIQGSSKTLSSFHNSIFITPSIYLYLTVHYGVLNQFLIQEKEKALFGENTFAPLYRLLSKFGADTEVSQYQPFYRTPVGANTGTYLREVYADFPVGGILVFPYALGFACSYYWFRVKERKHLVDLVMLSHLFVLVFMSVFVQASRLGYLWVSLIASLGCCYIFNRFSGKKQSGAEGAFQII
jgi:oligosaccharide repeat unit polymerase